jgi:site-specific DNA recombinase
MMNKSHNNDNGLRYIAYVRKSEERMERQQLSHQAQKRRIEEQFPDLNIVAWMEAESKSAFKPGRPIFDEMIAMIRQGKADGIVSYHPNRLSRNEVDAATLTYMFRTKELKDLKFCAYTFENSPEGVMFLQMVMSQSQYESSKQAREVKRGMTQKATNGERPGVVVQGYMKIPVMGEDGRPIIRPKDGRVVTKTGNDPERYELVRKMWQMMISGLYTPRQICKMANDEWGYTTRKTSKMGGNPLGLSSLYRIFNNPFYAGWLTHEGEWTKGNHKPMINLDQFDYVQLLLKERGKPRVNTYEYAFTGMIKCGECGCSVVGKHNAKYVKREGKIVHYVHYHCTRKSTDRICAQTKYTTVEDLEKEIDAELAKYTILPEFRDLALDILNRNHKVEVKSRRQIYSAQQGKRNAIQDQLDRLIDMRTKGDVDEDEYARSRNRLKMEIVRADEALRTTEDRAEEWLDLTEKAFNFATYARVHFKEGTARQKRSILMTLGENLTLRGGKLSITPSEWLKPIGESYPELEKRYLYVRTKQKATSPDEDMALLTISENWRARRDSNPRHSA